MIHFLPAILFLPLSVLSFFQSKAEKLKFIESPINFDLGSVEFMFTYVIWLQIGIYIFLSYKKLIRHQQNILLFASKTSDIDLEWLKKFILGIALMFAIWILDTIIFLEKSSVLATLGYFFTTYFLAYASLKQEEIYQFRGEAIVEIKNIVEKKNIETVKASRIADNEIDGLKTKINLLMQKEKLYLDEALSLPKLAEKMDMSVHDLSYLLNVGISENFFQFVNKYRVEEAKALLTSAKYEQLNMLGIAYESGFSSKTTFNTAFKKITGVSPSEYLTASKTL